MRSGSQQKHLRKSWCLLHFPVLRFLDRKQCQGFQGQPAFFEGRNISILRSWSVHFLARYLMMFLYWKYLPFFFLHQTSRIFFFLAPRRDRGYHSLPLRPVAMKKGRSNNFSSLSDPEAHLGSESSSDSWSSSATQPHVFLSLTHRLFLATSKHTDLWNMERKALWNKTGTNSG